MNEKEEKIRKMVADGKISEEEGQKLLNALKESNKKESIKSILSIKEILYQDDAYTFPIVSLVLGICAVCLPFFGNVHGAGMLFVLLLVVMVLILLVRLSYPLGIATQTQDFLIKYTILFCIILAESTGWGTFILLKRVKDKRLSFRLIAVAGILLGFVGFIIRI